MFYNRQTNCFFFDYYALLEYAYQKAVDELLELGLVELENMVIDFRDVNIRRIFQHHIIFEICETILKSKVEGFKVIYYHLPLVTQSRYLEQMGEYNEKDLEKLLVTITGDLLRYFPITFYAGGRLSLRQFKETIDRTETGEAQFHIQSVISTINTFDPTTYRFDKIQNVVKKRKLTFLSEHYFNQFNTKKLVYHR